MPDQEHLKILKQGVNVWNEWKINNLDIQPNLDEADLINSILTKVDFDNVDLHNACLVGADLNSAKLANSNLRRTNLSIANIKGANLEKSNLNEANLNGTNLNATNMANADLRGASLKGSDLSEANLHKADLRGANLSGAVLLKANLSSANLENAILSGTDLSGADISNSNLSASIMIGSNLDYADLSNSNIYGISAWELSLDNTIQNNLTINQDDDFVIQVDNFEIAHFMTLLLNHKNIHNVIESISSKIVLILGRFSEDRKDVLAAISDELRSRDYLPAIIDFRGEANKNNTEKIATLARISKFIIADITGSSNIAKELQKIVPDLPSVPVQPLLQNGGSEHQIFDSERDYPWVSPIFHYENIDTLLPSINDHIIAPTEIILDKLVKN